MREGKYALRIDGTNAARKGKLDRIEFQHQPKPPGTAEGTERYFGWSVFVPKKLTDDYHSVGYFETRNSWRQLMAFEVHGEDIMFSTRVPYTPPLDREREAHARPLARLRRSRPVVARRRRRALSRCGSTARRWCRTTMTATLLDENLAFFQIGFMRDTSDVPETIIIDHVVEATTLEDVTPPKAARH